MTENLTSGIALQALPKAARTLTLLIGCALTACTSVPGVASTPSAVPVPSPSATSTPVPQNSVDSDAQTIVARQNHIQAVQTDIALIQYEQTVETSATQVAAGATATALAAPIVATATAQAQTAEQASVATLTVAGATATAQAVEARRVAIATAAAAGATATAQTVQAGQDALATAAVVNAQAQKAAAARSWLDRCIAAVGVTDLQNAVHVATITDTIEKARATAGENQYFQSRGRITDPAAAAAACQKAQG